MIGRSMPGLCILVAASMAWGLSTGAVRADDDRAGMDMDTLRATQAAFRAIANRVRPSLVRIETVGGVQPTARAGRGSDEDDDERDRNLFRDALGSNFQVADGPTTGIVYSADGYIIASSFNFVLEPLVIFVTLDDGRRLEADLVARDKVRKIALLKVAADDLVVPAWRDADDVRIGEWAVALGLGYGGDEPSVTAGIVSALDRMYHNAIQTDAKLSPANYGGPLCDIAGKIIGICVPMAQKPGELAGVDFYDSGIGFVVPYHRVEAIVEQLKTGESIYRGWLGIQVNARARGGAHILRIADPSPVREVGIRPGDKIRWAEGTDVDSFSDLVKAIYMIPAGEEVYLSVDRRVADVQHVHHLGRLSYADTVDRTQSFAFRVTLARNTELGPIPRQEEPEFGVFEKPPDEEDEP